MTDHRRAEIALPPRVAVDTNELIDWFNMHVETGLTLDELDVAIPVAIDAVYAARDAQLYMHAAGAAAGVAAARQVKLLQEDRLAIARKAVGQVFQDIAEGKSAKVMVVSVAMAVEALK